MPKYIIFFKDIRRKDVAKVGGKTSSLGEMFSIGLPVPNGFAITADAYRYFITFNKLDKRIRQIVKKADIKNVRSLHAAGSEIRKLIEGSKFPKDMEKEITAAYKKLGSKYVAVRSSATAEDLPDASFAGQQESYMNVSSDILDKVKKCFASLFTDRAISYREDKKFDHFKVYLSVAVQKQIFSKVSGVMFTLDPDSGHRNFIVINGSYGLGDYIVQGKVVPDEFVIFKKTCKIVDKKLGDKKIMEIRSKIGVHRKTVTESMQNKFSLTDKEAEQLANYGKLIEEHYGCAMDIEWAKGDKLYLIQARPETVHSSKNPSEYVEYALNERSRKIGEGIAVGKKIAAGEVNVIRSVKEMSKFKPGQILVTVMTDPDWEPIMKIAAGIVTEEGGRTSHAAIVSRELGVPAVIGVPNITKLVKTGDKITLDSSRESGIIYHGLLKYTIIKHDIAKMPKTKTKIYVNVGIPEEAMQASLMPVDGVGLAREEFIASSFIGYHPMEMIRLKREAEFIQKLTFGIAKIAAAFYPRPVVVRLSDFKTNEYATLKGGQKYEPKESNPMIGYRGASRYISKFFEPSFRMELKAMKKIVHEIGLDNVKIMVPFCRTMNEAEKTLRLIKSEKIHAEVGVMAEIPSNIILADKFSKHFMFFSIGSNDLTQLTLGIDRDSELLAPEFDERDDAVKRSIHHLITTAHKYKRTVGICGQAPSDYPDFTTFLVKEGIDSISVNPDVAIKTKLHVAKLEKIF
ncbi:MAG: phosphoenolpyruvate synthase [Candidatus Aenigmarchaeota archaeon]|nr:phosphoenolpyruvate synthase [Candidatus Aenigmarchaeota archaeon]